jgi:hypothetical protein
MFALRENMLLFTKRMRKYELEPVLCARVDLRLVDLASFVSDAGG